LPNILTAFVKIVWYTYTMVRAIKERAIIGPAGRVVIDHSDLPEGSAADVIVMVDDQTIIAQPARPLASYVGALKNQFNSPADADAYLRELRDEWERP
jgi:hypothetical protein